MDKPTMESHGYIQDLCSRWESDFLSGIPKFQYYYLQQTVPTNGIRKRKHGRDALSPIQTNSFGGTLSCQFCRTLPHEHYLATEKSNPPSRQPALYPTSFRSPNGSVATCGTMAITIRCTHNHNGTWQYGNSNIEGVVSDTTTVHAQEGDMHVTMPFTLLFP